MRDMTINLLKKTWVAVALSILMGILVGTVILAATGYNPIEAFNSLTNGIFGRPKYMVQVLIKSTPIILTGLSVAFAFKTGLFNIGAEGQFIVGAITAALVGYHFQFPPVIHFFVVIICAMVASGIWGGAVGFLKAKFGIHEVITSIMLNWVALYLNNYIISLPGFKKPKTEASYEALASSWSVVANTYKTSKEGKDAIMQNPTLADILLKTDLNYGFLIAIIAVIITWYVLNKTTKGFELRAVGQNKDAAEFAGINVRQNVFQAMAISGMIAGLAGALQITGTNPHRITVLAAHEGYGFDGIAVALMAGSNPIGCIFSGLFFGAIKYGGTSLQSDIGAPSEIISIIIGTIVFFIAMSTLFPIIANKLKKKGAAK